MTAMTYTEKYVRKHEDGAATVADLNARYPEWLYELVSTKVRPTGYTHTIRLTHRLDNLPHFSGCYGCRMAERTS